MRTSILSPFSLLAGLCFQLRLFFLFGLNAGLDGGNDKGPLFHRQVHEFGRFPAKLLQTEMGKVGLRVTVRN